jgi:TATA-box binding protein (TBP) (component of TFIID and TFIIIB)
MEKKNQPVMMTSKKPSVKTALEKFEFGNYPRYTTTFTPAINWKIDYVLLFEHLQLVDLPKTTFDNPKKSTIKLAVPEGSALSIKYKDQYKVVHSRGTEALKSQNLCFSNSATVALYVDKIVVLKVPASGKIQITGCRTESQVYRTVRHIWNHLQKIRLTVPDVMKVPISEVPKVIFFPAMNNINVNLGFNINKKKVHEFLYKDTEFAVIPNDKKYAGITAKLEVEGLKERPLVRHRLKEGKWYTSTASYTDFLAMLSAKDRQKEEKKTKYHTFLIFHSGKVIQTGPRYDLMENVFYYFVNLMISNRDKIEDKTIEVARKLPSIRSKEPVKEPSKEEKNGDVERNP